MGSGKLGGFCGPCHKKKQQALAIKKQEERRNGPPIRRDNFFSYGIRTNETGGFFPDKFPCESETYGIQKGGGK